MINFNTHLVNVIKKENFLEFEELPSSQPGALVDNSDDDIFSEEWCDNTGDDPDYTPDVKESPMSSETGSGWSSQQIDVRK